MEKKTWIKIVAVEAFITVILMLATAFPWVNYKYTAEDLQRLSDECEKTPDMALSYGSYRYTVEYDTQSDMSFAFLEMKSIHEGDKQLTGRMDMDALTLSTGITSMSSEAFIHIPAKDFVVYLYCYSNPGMVVRSVTVQKTIGGVFRTGIIAVCIASAVNLLIVFSNKRKKGLVKE